MRSLTLAALVAFAVAALPVAAGQSAPPTRAADKSIADGSAQRALANARKAWKAQGVPSYTYLLSVNGHRVTPATEVRIVVRNGQPPASARRDLKPAATVPRLFLKIQNAIAAKVEKLVVRYGRRGVPTSIFIDPKLAKEDDVGYLVRKFAPLRR